MYLRICCICSFGLMGQMTFERLLQSTGRTIYTMITQGMGALINIILDPILIFGYFGLPKMGIAGAATATVIGQNAAWILAMFYYAVHRVCYAVGIMAVGLVIIQTIPGRLLMLFDASETMLQIGVPALRIISLSFVFAGYCVILSGVFQALGNGIYSMMVSVARQLIVLLPVAFLFSRIGELSMVWFAYPVAEIASVAVSTFFYRRINHHIIHYIR